MAPHYKLTYFDFTGRAEPIRLILSYAEIPFEDNRISKEDWPKIKPTTPLEQLPIFEIDGQVFNQSIAICRYVAKEAKLTGNNDIENLKIDSSVDNLMDIHKKVIEYVFETDENKKKTLEEGLTQHVTKYLTKFEENAKKNGGFFAISRTSWADIMFLVEYEMLRNSLRKDVLAGYPTLIKVKNQVLANKGIRDWIKNRKEIKMFTFDLKQDL